MTTTRPRLGAVRHVLLAAIPVVVAAGFVACSSGDDDDTSAADGDTTTTTEPEDFEMQAADFVNLHDMTPVRGFFVDNKLGHLDEALDVANDPEGGTYPVGTIIQLVPQEAMVKRAAGFDEMSNDWEMFSLEVTPEGTKILSRGGRDVINQFGLGCVGCHSLAEPQFDFICEKNHGCDPLPLSDDLIKGIQDSDPRPRV